MDSDTIKEESLTDNSDLQANKSFDESKSENEISLEKSFTDSVGNVSTSNSDELSTNKENILNSDYSISEIGKGNSDLPGEFTEANVESGNQTIEASQENVEEVEQYKDEDPTEPTIIDTANDRKTQTNISTTDIKSEEGEEVFPGFATKLEEVQDFDIIKGLSRQEEVEIQQLITMEDKPVVESRPLSALNKRRIEESDMSSHCSSPALSISSQQSGTSFTKRSRTESPASRGSRKSTVDLSNPKYLVPFEYGWRREVVTRAITAKEDGISKDVYYFHPTGKKLRSLREVSEKLTPGVEIENFTFYKEPIGADPQFETVRNARGHGQNSPSEFGTPRTPVAPVKPKPAADTPVNSEGVRRTPPARSFVKTARDNSRVAKQEKIVLKFNKGTPKIALKKSPAVNGESRSPKPLPSKLDGPKVNPNAPLGPKRIITKRKNPLKPQNSDDMNSVNQTEGSEMDVGMMPPMWSPAGGSNISSSNESWSQLEEEKNTSEETRLEPCSIRCTKAMGLIPTLQCSVCLCLYHPECCDMGSTASYRPTMKYVCKKCQSKTAESKQSRHLLKHITPAVVTCDRNTPILSPKPIHPGLAPSPTNQNNPSVVRIPQPSRPKPNNSKPGNANPWLPPSNTVFRAPIGSKPPAIKPEDSTPPQAIVNINNKRYIVVPKHNVLSNQNQANKSDQAQNTTIITPTPNSTIIQGPPLYNNPFIKPSNNSSGVTLVPYIPYEGVTPDSTPQQYHVVNPLPAASTNQPDLPVGSSTPNHFPKDIDKTVKRPSVDGIDDSMQQFMRNICIGYSALLNVFQYLKVQELLRAGRVCKLWRDLASHPSLWRTVRMKNSQVSDWQGFTDSLARHGTKHLDLRKMLVALDETEEMWRTFAEHIANVQCLERLDMCRCSVEAIEQTLDACPQLLVFNAQMIGVKDQSVQQKLSLESFSKMNKLTELRMKSFFGFYLNGTLESLTSVADTLTMLSLTTVKELGCAQVHFVGELKNLETLELGECSDLPETFPLDVIAKLVKLKRIRFEKGPTKCSVNQMLIEMSQLPDLVQLELINFDITPGFDEALASCSNIKRLMLIPTYVTHSATTNNIILSGAFRLWKSLTHFIWVVTMELLKVTELFVDQCEGPGSKKSGGNSVPVLKPVPKPEVRAVQPNSELGKRMEEDAISSKNPITVIPLNELSEMLTEALPNTRVKLIKIPFQSTWRQCINFSDSNSASLS